MSKILNQINGLYLCREKQINKLYQYLQYCWPTVIVCGSRSTGKSAVVKTLLTKLHVFHVWINCLEIFNNKMIFNEILTQLTDRIEDFVTDSELNQLNPKTFSEFIEDLTPILRQFVDINEEKWFSKQCILVFDSIDVSQHLFNHNNSELLTTFTKLQELTDNICPISCLFISRQSTEWFSRITSSPLSAIEIHFTNYTTEEISTILLNDSPVGYDKDFYSNYINIILKTLTQYTRNFTEIRNYCSNNLCKYTEPITAGEMNATDSAKLYKRFQPILLQLIDQIPIKIDNQNANIVELPDCVKFLLISVYLSSYNSIKTDKKFFVKYQGKKKERKRKLQTEEKEYNGPKASTFERIVHIYKSVILLNAENSDDNCVLTFASNKLFSLIEELVSLKLIHKIHTNNKTNSLSSLTKYQISNSVNIDFIKELAEKLNFNINAFLE